MEPKSNSGLNRIELMILKDRNDRDVSNILSRANVWANEIGKKY